MFKRPLVDKILKISNQKGISVNRKDITTILDIFTNLVIEEVGQKGGKITLPQFGTFYRATTKATRRKRLDNKEYMQVPAQHLLKLRCSQWVRKNINPENDRID